jgi:hypothetical protein
VVQPFYFKESTPESVYNLQYAGQGYKKYGIGPHKIYGIDKG